jgi:[protein-PII] uridylyltransferase
MRHNPAQVKVFAESLPNSYKAGFDWAAIAEQAALSQRRQPGHPAVGICFAARFPGHALCVIADDRPGLLATISASLISERLDVIAAEAYTRRVSDTSREAVDIFWVRSVDIGDRERALSNERLTHLESTLDRLLNEHYDPKDARIPTQPPPSRTDASETIVRFIEDKNGTLTTLEVETSDRTGMLLVLSRSLHQQHVQIVSSTVRTEKSRVKDRFELTELDDSPIGPQRRLLVQMAVLEAIQQSFGR